MSPNRRRDASATCVKIALAQVNEAIRLAASKERNAPDSVHELRRISKRLRSLWRLVPPFAAEKNLSKEADKSLRAAARLLSRHRDAHIVRKTLRRIERNAKTDSERKAIGRIIEALKTLISQKVAPRLPDIRWGKISKTLQQEAERWKTLQEQGENDWREGVVQTYRKGRRLASRAFADNRPETFHSWRKGVKYLAIQLDALSENGLKVDSKLRKKIAQLAERLGNYHDLDNVRQMVRKHLETAADFRTVQCFYQVILRMESRAIRRFQKDYKDVFAYKPKTFVAKCAPNSPSTSPKI